jgi:hypothetical protein
MTPLCEGEMNFWRVIHADHVARNLSIFVFVFQFKFEFMEKHGNDDSWSYFSKSFTETTSLTSHKRHVACRVSFFTRWSQVIRTFRVESLRNELSRFLPFFGVVVKAKNVDTDFVILLKLDVSNFQILSHFKNRG